MALRYKQYYDALMPFERMVKRWNMLPFRSIIGSSESDVQGVEISLE